MAQYQLKIFADYFQFYVQDELAEGDFSEGWTPKAIEDMLALTDGAIGVGTIRNMTVPVTVQVLDAEPDELFTRWDRVNECSLEISSERFIVVGCTEDYDAAIRIPVRPGCYRARIYYGNLDTISANGLEGEDHYKVALWPAKKAERLIRLKRQQSSKFL